MNSSVSRSNLSVISLLLASFWTLAGCQRNHGNTAPEAAVQLSSNTTISELLAKASDAASEGNESYNFKTESGNVLRLEFPLLDGNRKHWQFKALQEIEHHQGQTGEVATSEATVLFTSKSETTWVIGTKAYSDNEMENRIKALASKNQKSVLVIRATGRLPVSSIERIWGLTHAVGTRLVLYDSTMQSERPK